MVESCTYSVLKLTGKINDIRMGHNLFSKLEQLPWRQEMHAAHETVD
jgi:hypothetical protein